MTCLEVGLIVAGRYRIEARIRESTTGVFFRARHVLVDRIVELKFIRPDLLSETHLRAWFLREGRAVNRVRSNHVIHVEDIGELEDGQLYLVMAHVEGRLLSDDLAAGRMPVVRALGIVKQLAAVLKHAHEMSVVHRDVRSPNVLLTKRDNVDDFVKLFGFERCAIAWDPRLEPKGISSAAPAYMSPEQAVGGDGSPAGDYYSLGVIFYEMLAGQLPFAGRTPAEVLAAHRNEVPPRPSQVRPGVDPDAENLCMRLLAKEPTARPGSELADEVGELLRSHL